MHIIEKKLDVTPLRIRTLETGGLDLRFLTFLSSYLTASTYRLTNQRPSPPLQSMALLGGSRRLCSSVLHAYTQASKARVSCCYASTATVPNSSSLPSGMRSEIQVGTNPRVQHL